MNRKRVFDLNNFMKYFGCGQIAFFADMALLIILVESVGLGHVLASSISFIVAIKINFVLNKKITYRGSAFSWSKEFSYFLTFALLGAAFVPLFMYIGVDILGFGYIGFRIFLAAVIGVLSYVLNTLHTFKFEHED